MRSYHTLAEPARTPHPNQLRFLRAGVPFHPTTPKTHNTTQRQQYSPRLHPIIPSTSPTPSLVSSLDSTATSSSLAVPTLGASEHEEDLGDSWFALVVKDASEGKFWRCARKTFACFSILAATACLGYGIYQVIVFIHNDVDDPHHVWCNLQRFP